MKLKEIAQQPLFRSFLLHSILLLGILLVFLYKEPILEDIPIEITEFVRNLGNPTPEHHSAPQKKTTTQTVPHGPTSSSANGTSSAPASPNNTGGEAVSEDYEVSEMPILLNEVRIPYPPDARAKNIQGNVVFDLLISSKGAVSDLKVVSSPDPILTFAARNAVTLFKFRPAKMNEKPVAIRIRYTYRFLLQ